jgi:hypothetical protein
VRSSGPSSCRMFREAFTVERADLLHAGDLAIILEVTIGIWAESCGAEISAFAPLSGDTQTSGERVENHASDPRPTSSQSAIKQV